MVRRRIRFGRCHHGGRRNGPVAGEAPEAPVQTGHLCQRVHGPGQAFSLADDVWHDHRVGRDQVHSEKARVANHGRPESGQVADAGHCGFGRSRRCQSVQRTTEEDKKASAIRHRFGGRRKTERKRRPSLGNCSFDGNGKPCRTYAAVDSYTTNADDCT